MYFCPDDGSGIVMMLNTHGGFVVMDEVFEAFCEASGW
jgi:hypothetical protein